MNDGSVYNFRIVVCYLDEELCVLGVFFVAFVTIIRTQEHEVPRRNRL